MRALLIEDDNSMAKSIGITLAAEGIDYDIIESGIEGVEKAKIYDYDIIILDLMLPDISGYDVLVRMRSIKIQTPVLILSGLSTINQKITGLGFGADDYLTKPFNRHEVIARIKAIARRSKNRIDPVVNFDNVSINLDTRIVKVNEKQVHLPTKEYGVLELLVIRKGTIVTKKMFVDHLYGNSEHPKDKIVDVFVCKLRKKLGLISERKDYIETIHGRGYMLKVCTIENPLVT